MNPSDRLSSADVVQCGLQAGLAAVGITDVAPLEPARSVLQLRKKRGLASSMAFTYKNPERSSDPSQTLRRASSLIVGAYDYYQGGVDAPDELSARVARYAWADHYTELRSRLEEIAILLRGEGARARVVADQNDLVDRNVAYRAGIGWYGKNANLLLPEMGSWFVLGTVVTDYTLEPSSTPIADGCGSCSLCETGCPTGAIVGPGVIDARRCLAWLLQGPDPIPREFREAVGDRIYGCDDCQDVCPANRVRPEPASVAAGAPLDRAYVSLAWLLTASDAEILAEVGQWYIANRDANVVRRSALVAFGNTADPDDPETADLVQRHLDSSSALVRAHAVWACRRLGLDALLTGQADETDPEVRGEYDGVVTRRTDKREY